MQINTQKAAVKTNAFHISSVILAHYYLCRTNGDNSSNQTVDEDILEEGNALRILNLNKLI